MQKAVLAPPTSQATPQARILVVDDDPRDRDRLARLLAPCGHRVAFAASRQKGIECCRHDPPDLLILNVDLCGLGSLDVASELRETAGDRWLPLIFVARDLDAALIEKCFEAGGNDFVHRDASDVEVRARVAAVLRHNQAYKEQHRQLSELTYHRDMAEREEEIAQKIFQSIMAQDSLNRPGVRYRLSAMSVFNGDLLLASRTPDGGIHLLIGDFTGHGLSASIGTLPASEIFYAMSIKGFGIVDILREINRRLKKLLPVGMFMMGAGVQIDKAAHTARIWSGGIPDLLLRRADGGEVERIRSRHLPLGVLDADGFDAEVDIVSLREGDRLLMFTDGVTETEQAGGAMFGIDRVVQVVAGTSDAANAFDELNQALEVFRGGHEQSDDVTLIEYTCPPPLSFEAALPPVTDSSYDTEFNTEWQFRLHLDSAALRTFDPRPLVTQILMDIQSLYDDREPLYTIISEIFRVCLEQGVLAVERAGGCNDGHELDYQREVAERLSRLEHGAIHIEIDHAAAHDGGGLVLQFSHNGRPLDAATCPTLDALERICRSVRIEGEGQRVVATYFWKSI